MKQPCFLRRLRSDLSQEKLQQDFDSTSGKYSRYGVFCLLVCMFSIWYLSDLLIGIDDLS